MISVFIYLLLFSQFLTRTYSTELLLELEEDVSLQSFKKKYEKLIADSRENNLDSQFSNDNKSPEFNSPNHNNENDLGMLRCFDIPRFKMCIGGLSIDLMKPAYFDNSIKRISLDRPVKLAETQEFAPKHLVRISQNHKILKRQEMEYQFERTIDQLNVVTTKIYLLDTGVNHGHLDFGTRAKQGMNLVSDGFTGDPHGHGTAVAGIVGGEVYGVNKECEVIDYRIFDSRGRSSIGKVIEALSEIVKNQEPGVILMPFVTESNKILNSALREVKRNGFALVAAAGNFGADACKYSPASSKDVLTVGSIDPYTDNLAFFTNWGECVDVFSDGVNVATLSNTEDVVTMRSGTSFSAAQGAGILASFMSLNDTSEEATSRLKNLAITGVIPEISIAAKPKTPNKILSNYKGKASQTLNS